MAVTVAFTAHATNKLNTKINSAIFNWQQGEIGTSLTYFIISAVRSFFCIAYFYAGFFGNNESIENDETH